MTFWQQVLSAAGPGFPLAVIVFVLAALILFAIRPLERSRLRAALRQQPPDYSIAGCDFVLISRQPALDCPFLQLRRDMEFAFSRIPTMKYGTFNPAFSKKHS